MIFKNQENFLHNFVLFFPFFSFLPKIKNQKIANWTILHTTIFRPLVKLKPEKNNEINVMIYYVKRIKFHVFMEVFVNIDDFVDLSCRFCRFCQSRSFWKSDFVHLLCRFCQSRQFWNLFLLIGGRRGPHIIFRLFA